MRKIESIQGLRGLSALSVVVFHEFDSLKRYSSTSIDDMTFRLHVLGTAGVDVFFCISGFIMLAGLQGSARPADRADFLVRRAIRIVPTYWLLTLVMFGLRLAQARHDGSLSPRWRHLAASLAFLPSRNEAGLVFPVLSPGWTLSYEMLFYLAFAAFMGLRRRRAALAVTLLPIGLVAAGYAFRPSLAGLQVATSPLLLEFAFGMVVALIVPEPDAARALPLGIACIVMCLAIFAATHAAFVGSDSERLLIRGVPAALLLMGAVCLARSPLFTWGPLLALGEASYSIYLMHDILLPLLNRGLAGTLGLPVLPVALSGIVAALLAGLLFFAIVERPVTRSLARAHREHSSRARPIAGKIAVNSHE